MIKEILNKYRNLPKPAKASMWFVISNVVLKGISFITLPIFSRLLTTEEYGITSVYQSWVTLVSILTTLTIWGGVFNVGMVKYAQRREEVISSFQGLAIFITGLFLVISIPFLNYLAAVFGISELLIICMYIEIIAQIPFNLWSAQQRYDYEYKKLIAITFITAILNPVIGYFAVINSIHKPEARIITWCIIQFMIGFILFIVNQKKGKRFFNKELWSYGAKFNIVLIPHYLSAQVLNQADRIMINYICGGAAAGIYSVAYNFSMLLTLVINGINASFTPYIYQCVSTGKTGNLRKYTTGIVAFVAGIDLLCICLIPDIFKFMLPHSYYEAIWVIPPVTAAAFFLFLYPLFGSIEFYFEEKKYVTYASCIGAVANIVLNYFFITWFGFLAAAYTTLFCYICFSICHYYFMCKILRKKNFKQNLYDIKALTLISVILLISMFLLLCLYNHYLARWGTILTCAIVCWVLRNKIIQFVKEMEKRSE